MMLFVSHPRRLQTPRSLNSTTPEQVFGSLLLQESIVKARDQIILDPDELPGSWYNVIADLPGEFPKPKDPEEGPSRLEYLSKVLLKHCLQQEISTERWISIPAPVQDLYRQAGRPRPLYRARRLERFLGPPQGSITNERIFRQQGPIRSTQPSRRHTMRQRKDVPGSRQRQGPASGAPRSPMPQASKD